MMQYKGYVGSAELDSDRGILRGEVVNTRDVITYEGTSVAELTRAFHDSVDDYLAFCKEREESPEKPFSGKFQVRLSPDLHRALYLRAREEKTSLNTWVAGCLERSVAEPRKR